MSKKGFKEKHDEIVNLVSTLLQLNEEIRETKLDVTRQQIQIKTVYCENKIDQIVFQIYELSEQEINQLQSE